MKNVFIDTNILISFLDRKRDKYEESKKLLSNLMDEYSIIFSEDILTNVVYNSKNLKKEAVEMFDFMNNSKIFEIVYFGKDVINLANHHYLSQDNFTNKNDYEDTLQYFCALKNRCVQIYTDDISNFPKLDIPLYKSNNKPFYIPN